MMHPQSTALPCEARSAWKLLGNSVSPLQCAVGLCAVELALGSMSKVEADALIRSFFRDAIRINGVTPCVVDGWVSLHLLEAHGALTNPDSPGSDVKSDDSALACGAHSCHFNMASNDGDSDNPPGGCDDSTELGHKRDPEELIGTPEAISPEEWETHTALFNKIPGFSDQQNSCAQQSDLLPLCALHHVCCLKPSAYGAAWILWWACLFP